MRLMLISWVVVLYSDLIGWLKTRLRLVLMAS